MNGLLHFKHCAGFFSNNMMQIYWFAIISYWRSAFEHLA